MITALSCLLLRFVLLLRPKKERLFDNIKRRCGRSTIKDIFNLIDHEKKSVKCNFHLETPLLSSDARVFSHT